ncbi:MAG: M42 family metallopeptidase [Pyrobaculum sp.]|uniref:Cellulase n=2 Tax=Pyrobaculum arsenaticum TaxID=121277 RepID=A4WI33_PYRAR|nr:M42 family metallopeptidase [Pyrobaculum arsenaticum]ABP50050.1 Cellulase [Pyrobaculum arsenaticum DSM 13514]MCY0889642.1 M42 family metallopeptidase [Pyrobaculum arsenaticum]NYR14981.1 M42 family metallopeptidase [Pyrobaculum arsenaticum]
MEDFVQLLKKLSEARGPSGFEDEVREVVIREMEPYVDEVVVDKWGNVIGVKRGSSDYRAMVAAHIDEIGLVVDHIEKEGYLRFRPIGGWNEVTLVSQRVWVRTSDGRWIRGVVGSLPPHVTPSGREREAPEIKDLYIDIGVYSREEAEKLGVTVGSVVVLDREFAVLNGKVVTGKAFDDRVGVAVMLYALRMLEKLPVTLYAVATVQEEVGLRGASVAAERINPHYALALDTTIAADVPGVGERLHVTKLGKGPAIKVLDGGRGGLFIAHPGLRDHIVKLARELGIPYQMEVLYGGTTDAMAIAFRREGVPAAVISVPTRYIHSPVEVLDVEDAVNAAKLLKATLERTTPEIVEKFLDKRVK